MDDYLTLDDAVRIEFFTDLYHSYPGFRDKAARVENYLLNGVDHDIRKEKMDMKALASFGKIEMLKPSDVIR